MVQETRAVEGVVFNQPVEKLEPHEDIFEGTCREVKEETGLDVELTDFPGSLHLADFKRQYFNTLLFHRASRPRGTTPRDTDGR